MKQTETSKSTVPEMALAEEEDGGQWDGVQHSTGTQVGIWGAAALAKLKAAWAPLTISEQESFLGL